jgi:cytochrome P450 family 4
VGAALTFSLYFLAAHQDIQDKVMDELNSIFAKTNREVTFEDVFEMKYLEQCIKETMRLCPSVPLIARKLTEEVLLGRYSASIINIRMFFEFEYFLGKYVLPVGTNIFISPFATHRLPHIFPNPLKFDPERFSPENKMNIHPYGYIPFSAGPRNCIGIVFIKVYQK